MNKIEIFHLIMLFMAIAIIIVTVKESQYFWVRINKQLMLDKNGKQKLCAAFLLCIVVVSMGYGCLIVSNHYSVDSFNLVWDMGPFWHMQIGRYVNCSMILLAQLFGWNQVLQQNMFLLFWMITLVVMIMMIAISLAKCLQIKKSIEFFIIILVVTVAFLNVNFMEFMLFPEMAMVLIFGNLALGLSINFAIGDFVGRKKWLLSSIFLLIAIGNYQSYIGVFESFVLIGLFFKWRNDKRKYVKESFFMLLLGASVSVFNVFLVKFLMYIGIIVDSGRGANFQLRTIIYNIKQLLKYQFKFWENADGLMLAWVMPIIGILLLLIIFIMIIKIDFFEKKALLILFVTSYVLGFAAHLIEAHIDLTPRSNLAVWSSVAIILIAVIGFDTSKKTILKYSLALVTVILILSSNIYSMQDMAKNTIEVNQEDFVEAEQICNKINDYEQSTGKKITKIAITNDESVTMYQQFSRYKNSQLGSRILATSYSGYRLIGYKLNRSLEKIDMPKEIYEEYFKGKNWDGLNLAEQMFFKDDTLYLAIY